MKKVLLILIGLLVLVGLGRGLLKLPIVQDMALERAAQLVASRASARLPASDGLRVFVCGSASPLGVSDQAQSCIAVLTPEHFYLIDSGAGSTANISLLGLPTERLQGLLITHFHSDHIAEIYEVNLASWVSGRPKPLIVYGPEGIEEVTNGVNTSYRRDRMYRSAHHGKGLLPPELGVLQHKTISVGNIVRDGELSISAYPSEHPPVYPAVGYRIDYRGRSVVISGDSNVTEQTLTAAAGADLLLHDALSLPIVKTISEALESAGQDRQAKIVTDVIDYHASTESLIELGKQSDVGMIAYYHLVPSPANTLLKNIFMRDAPDNFVLTEDRMSFELPIGKDEIVVTRP